MSKSFHPHAFTAPRGSVTPWPVPFALGMAGLKAHHRVRADTDDAKARIASGESLWQQASAWREMVSNLCDFPRDIRVLELCGGLSSGFLALQALLGQRKVTLAGYYDFDWDLQPAMRAIHGSSSHVFIGQRGDLRHIDTAALADAEVIVAGPPCPPWSSLGKRGSFDDPRAAIFWKVINAVIDVARRGVLLFFVLENVAGILKRPSGASEPPLQAIVQELKNALPNFQVEVLSVNTCDFSLPQSRPRVYILGRRASVFGAGQRPSLQPFIEKVALRDLLDVHDKRKKMDYTSLQEANIADFKTACAAAMNNQDNKGQYAVVDVTRTPTDRTAWGRQNNKVRPDQVECLTASGPALHVFALGEGTGELSLDRPLRGTERGRLQGFPEFVCQVSVSVKDSVAKRMFGNAMSLPVVGAILGRELQVMQRICRPMVSAGPTPIPLHAGTAPRPSCALLPSSAASSSAGVEPTAGQEPAARQDFTNKKQILLSHVSHCRHSSLCLWSKCLVYGVPSTFSSTCNSVSTKCLPRVYQVSTKCLQSVYQVSTKCLPSVYRVSTMCLQSVYHLSTKCLPGVYQVSTNCLLSTPCLPIVYQVSTECLPSVYNISEDKGC